MEASDVGYSLFLVIWWIGFELQSLMKMRLHLDKMFQVLVISPWGFEEIEELFDVLDEHGELLYGGMRLM